jgi:hypothetical protein
VSAGARDLPPAAVRAAGPGLAAILLVAVLFVLTQHPGVLSVPFVGDDYFFLGKTQGAPFLSVWAPQELVSRFYRPWSRELHYWTLQRLFGERVGPGHAVSLLLWVGIVGLYFTFVRRLAGTRVATLASAAVMALAGWGAILVWVSGAQDLWMMLFALLALYATLRDRPAWACAAQLLALLSKETAALLPGLAFGLEWLVRRRPPAVALRRVVPLLALTLAWAALHPLLGGRLWWPRHDAVLPGLHPPPGLIAARTLLAVVNLHAWPAPESGWPTALRTAVPGALGLVALVGWASWRAARAGSAPAGVAPPQVAAFGALWALLGWLPLLMPTVGWHAYYGLFGALGAWVVLSVALARAQRGAWLVVLGLALLQAGLATTPSQDWGTEWFQRRAAAFSEESRAALLGLRPSLPRGSRVFLSGAPGGAGLLPGGEASPPLRFWYRDRALRAAAWERYRMRTMGDSLGEDVFLRYDRASGWREVKRGAAEPAPVALPYWRDDHERLAVALSRGGDLGGAFEEYVKLSRAFPADATYPYYAGLAQVAGGDSVAGLRWVRAAAALPAADEEIHAAVRWLSGGR